MLSRKSRGSGAVLAYRAHLLTENRNGLVVSTLTTRAYGSAERDAALLMAGLPGTHRVTLGADKGYDAHDFIAELRHMEITPHIAQNDTSRRSAVDDRTTRHAGYEVSQKKRKRIEEVFGWMKSIGLLRKLRHRGLERVGWMFTFAAAVYNLVRIRNLIRSAPQPQWA
jgi:IS5 family transposase